MKKAESSIVETRSKAHTELLEDLQRLDEVVHSVSDDMAELHTCLITTQAHLKQNFHRDE